MENKKKKHIALFLKTSHPSKIDSKNELLDYLLSLSLDDRIDVSMALVENRGSFANIPTLLHDLPKNHGLSARLVSELVHTITEQAKTEIDEEACSFMAKLIDGCADNPEQLLSEIISFSSVTSNFRFVSCKEGDLSLAIENKIKASNKAFFEDKWLLRDFDRFFIYNDVSISLFDTYLSRLDDKFADELLIKMVRNGRLVNTSIEEASYADSFIKRDGVEAVARKVADTISNSFLVCDESTPQLIEKFVGTDFLNIIIEKSPASQIKEIALMMIKHISDPDDYPSLTNYILDDHVGIMLSSCPSDFNALVSIIDRSSGSIESCIYDYLEFLSKSWFGKESPGGLIKELLEDEGLNFQHPEEFSRGYHKITLAIQHLPVKVIAEMAPDLSGKAVENLMILNPDIKNKVFASLFKKSRHMLISKDLGL